MDYLYQVAKCPECEEFKKASCFQFAKTFPILENGELVYYGETGCIDCSPNNLCLFCGGSVNVDEPYISGSSQYKTHIQCHKNVESECQNCEKARSEDHIGYRCDRKDCDRDGMCMNCCICDQSLDVQKKYDTL